MPFLDWVNKNQAQQAAREVPYHLLKQEAVYGDPAENLLIQGDNLLALKALIPFYAGRVKCIFIDPPYNTQSAFAHYDDKLEHSQWLSMMYPRLVLLRDLLAEDGSIWVTIDDNEAHYLKVLMDEVFGRKNFIVDAVWRTTDNSNNNVTKFSLDHNNLLVYAKKSDWCPNFLDDPKKRKHFKNPDNDPRGSWFDGNPVNNPGLRPNLQFNITSPTGHVIKHPPNGWRWSLETIHEKLSIGELRFSEDGKRIIRRTYLADMEKGLPPSTLWTDLDETGHNRQAKYELKNLFPDVPVTSLFGTPKPERLIEKVLRRATNHGDLVLDSFAGSATTAAVAHKMNRRYIGIEMGDHAVTHCIPRLHKVIEGEQGGISEAVSWQGGGGFRFCTLGEAAFDEHGRINAAVKFATLAAFVWHFETGIPSPQLSSPQVGSGNTPLLGIHNGTAYYLLYNGILGDRKPSSGNVLTHAVLQAINDICPHAGHKIIYGETTRLGAARLAAESITFKQIPYDVKMRG
jgi:adenine-specific DNA-methyltransferase